MDVVPVAQDGQDQQQKRDQQQARGLGGVDRVTLVLVGVVVLGIGFRHADIVALGKTKFIERSNR